MLRPILIALLLSLTPQLCADDPPSAVGSVLKLLKGGRVPESNLPRILDLICSKGNEHDLAYVFGQVAEGTWPENVQESVLSNLLAASQNRKVIPAGDHAPLLKLLASQNPSIQHLAIELAGAWKSTSATTVLQEHLAHAETGAQTRKVVLDSLVQIDPVAAQSAIDVVLKGDSPFDAKSIAVSALVKLHPQQAATAAATLLTKAGERDDPRPLLNAFLEHQKGSDLLAAALQDQSITPDLAKLALRHMYSEGRSDQKLNELLSRVAGINEEMKLPTPEELQALVNEIRTNGDPARGEEVFRRSDLSCQKCHAVSKAGGQVGPDLSAVGSTSPVEYLAMSVLDPDQVVKEAYITKVVLTDDGRVLQGIMVDQSDETIVLKDPNGKTTTIARADIEEQIDGKSLMPKGLVKFMTHAEFLDLVSFLSQLGKPGQYAIRSTARMQRWQLLQGASASLVDQVPNILQFEDEVLGGNWASVYARVNGELPLEGLKRQAGQMVLYVSGEVDVRKAGAIQLSQSAADGVTIWIDKEALPNGTSTAELAAGRHRVTLRIDTTKFSGTSVILELSKAEGSAAEFAVVDGQ